MTSPPSQERRKVTYSQCMHKLPVLLYIVFAGGAVTGIDDLISTSFVLSFFFFFFHSEIIG